MKIIDAFLFNNEQEIVDFRLRVLYPYVDYFLVVEADKTFSGKPKELTFVIPDWAKDKILYKPLSLPVLPEYTAPEGYDPSHICWKNEYAQRNYIGECLSEFDDNDILMLGDVDEIPTVEIVEKLKNISQSQMPFAVGKYDILRY